ncbi:acetylcholine receptor subunit alpha-type acr-16-like isoform X4 [Aphis craccivora]|uniref:Acetylcholine receptor subunit alpha-type acr-16-like isoform X4 n=1 Tax=Aphis craccivora TaxID=307492 RepID=A0A6G0ZH43_APHCR|nr:acetylcholine receptor subunit alpha-type acr-16-like isoform X4 [Aphis craccivora]
MKIHCEYSLHRKLLNNEWVDYNMRWNISEYGGVKDLRLNPNRLWKPDILMYNSADEKFDGTYQTNVVVRHNGTCLYVPPGIFKSTCKIDITWFPFDDQNCLMKFGSWTYNGFQIDLVLKSDGGDLSDFTTNGEWYFSKLGRLLSIVHVLLTYNTQMILHVTGMPGKKNVITYGCCPEPYVDITFIIKIRRRTLYYFFNLIVPCVLISSMALLGFTLPPDCGEKLTLEITILLSLTVFLNLVAESMPTTSEAVPLIGVTILLSLTVFLNLVAETLPQVSDAIPLLGVAILLSQVVYLLRLAEVLPESSDAVPLLGTYFNCIMFMVASSVVLTLVVLNYHHRTADIHTMGPWVKCFFLLWLPWILCMQRPGKDISFKAIRSRYTDRRGIELRERSSRSLLANVLDIDDDFRASVLSHRVYNNGAASSSSPASESRSVCNYSARELQLILQEVRYITDHMRKQQDDQEVINDWKYAAMVVDRFCLIVFTFFTLVATVAVMYSAPHIITLCSLLGCPYGSHDFSKIFYNTAKKSTKSLEKKFQ